MTTYYILFTESGTHQPRVYDRRRNGASVTTYDSLAACQAACDRLDAEDVTPECSARARGEEPAQAQS